MGGLGRGKGWAPSISIVSLCLSLSFLRAPCECLVYDLSVLLHSAGIWQALFLKKLFFHDSAHRAFMIFMTIHRRLRVD